MLLNSYKIWPAVQIINFYLLPFEARLLVGSLVSLIWNTCEFAGQIRFFSRVEVNYDYAGGETSIV